MIQLLIVGIIIIFILGAMLFSHSQSMQRFAVLEFLLILAIVVVAGLCMTRTQAFMKEQYFELFRVYMPSESRICPGWGMVVRGMHKNALSPRFPSISCRSSARLREPQSTRAEKSIF